MTSVRLYEFKAATPSAVSAVRIYQATFSGSTAPTTVRLYGATLSGLTGPPDLGDDLNNIEPYSTVFLSTVSGDGTLTWSQVSGTGVTFNSAGSSLSFTAPPTRSGTSMVFQLIDSASRADQITVNVLPQNEWAVIGGVEVPCRVSTVGL